MNKKISYEMLNKIRNDSLVRSFKTLYYTIL